MMLPAWQRIPVKQPARQSANFAGCSGFFSEYRVINGVATDVPVPN
jgi:hypothetical protein